MTYVLEHILKDIESSPNDDELFTLCSGAGVMAAACVLSPASCSSP